MVINLITYGHKLSVYSHQPYYL